MRSNYAIWVYSPGNVRGIGLLVIAAIVNETGVVDLNEISPEKWGNLPHNLIELHKFYPVAASLGFRLPLRYLQSLIDIPEFPSDLKIFFVLAGSAAPAELQVIKDFPQFNFYIEVHSSNELSSVESYCGTHHIPLTGYVAVSAESAGRMGNRSALLLVQELRGLTARPVMLRGGIGIHSAGALPLSDLAGMVLDDQVLLFPGSPLGRSARERIAQLDGREFEVLGKEHQPQFRVLRQPWAKAAQNQINAYQQICLDTDFDTDETGSFKQFSAQLRESFFWGDTDTSIWPVGQMIGLAGLYQKKYSTLHRFIKALKESSTQYIEQAYKSNSISAGSPLALAHKTTFPVVQGPMTRVSDSPEFALRVADAGGLPFLALALLEGEPLRRLLTNTQVLLKCKSWGIGILGFVSPELRAAQITEVLKVKPDFAIIAGGRPDHAQRLEREGIKTYLHVPVPSLLRSFIKQGSRRFIFEGRECGGHVGPYHSFPLWEQMITILLDEIPAAETVNCSVLFAGGISNALSSAMVAAMAARLTAKGIKVGILMGTAYLACEETVNTGAITKVFQDSIVHCSETTLLISGTGHANRCVSSPFANEFKRRRHELLLLRSSQEEISAALDGLLLGRLRVASKGIQRKGPGKYEHVSEDTVKNEGMFMAGDVANLLKTTTSISALHKEVTEGAGELIRAAQPKQMPKRDKVPEPANIAIVGINLFVPGANDVGQFWNNILYKKNQIKEIPPDRWDWRLIFDADPHAPDKIYSRWGGFINDLVFDPLKYGIAPKSVPNITTAQLLALESVTAALEDAGMKKGNMDRDHTSVIFATTDAGGFMANSLAIRSSIPFFSEEAVKDTLARTPQWTGETFAGVLSNVVPGRVANCFDFGGRNYAVDAACASSLAALDLAVRELVNGRSNIVVTGGIDVGQTPFGYMAFCKTGALSPTGESLSFDKNANGIVMSEGSAVLILKRLEDAQRDGNKIYAVIKGIGGSSDGRAMGLTAPRSEGQQLSLSRAYEEAGFRSDTIGYYEAHGTGTVVGDREELDTICRTLKQHGAAPKSVALGAVKSLLGHTKMAAGMVSIAKAALSLHYKVLSPQGNIQDPLEKIAAKDSPLFFYDQAVPWLKDSRYPRRAGVSAFGFGGTNFHAVLEEYTGYEPAGKLGGEQWPEELIIFSADSPVHLLGEVKKLAKQLSEPLSISLRDLSWNLVRKYAAGNDACRLSFAASGLDQLGGILGKVTTYLQDLETVTLPANISYKNERTSERPEVAFLFPGQGAQRPDMAREISLYFGEFRKNMELANDLLRPFYPDRLTNYIYPAKTFTKTTAQATEAALNDTHVAQPAIGLISVSYFDLLSRLGVRPGYMAGHSFGELTALQAAGVYTRTDFLKIAEFRSRLMAVSGGDEGTMAVVLGAVEDVQKLIDDLHLQLVIANYNAPDMVVISGSTASVEQAILEWAKSGIKCIKLSVSAAFHSPMMEKVREPFSKLLGEMPVKQPEIPVFSNLHGKPFPEEADLIREMLCDHLTQPVQFITQIRKMHQSGARIFVELGPNRVLSGLVDRILADEGHITLSADGPGAGLGNFLSLCGRLWVEGVTINLPALYDERQVEDVNLDRISASRGIPTRVDGPQWVINGHGARPLKKAWQTLLPQPIITLDNQSAQKKTMNSQLPDTKQLDEAGTENGAYTSLSTPPADETGGNANVDANMAAFYAYQDTMRQFLKTQEQVMAMFLGGGITPAADEHMQQPADKTFESRIINRVIPPSQRFPPVADPGRGGTFQEKNRMAHMPVANGVTEKDNGDQPQTISAEDVGVMPHDPDAVFRVLVGIISEQTGYPEDMIGIDLDVEAELGVDSIKRIEILGTFLSMLPKDKEAELVSQADLFVRIKQLRSLVEALVKALKGEDISVEIEEA